MPGLMAIAMSESLAVHLRLPRMAQVGALSIAPRQSIIVITECATRYWLIEPADIEAQFSSKRQHRA